MSELGTIIGSDGKATCFMPRWYFIVCLVSCFTLGLLVGAMLWWL